MGAIKKAATMASEHMNVPMSELLESKQGTAIVKRYLRKLAKEMGDIRYLSAVIVQKWESGVTAPKEGCVPIHYFSETNEVRVYAD